MSDDCGAAQSEAHVPWPWEPSRGEIVAIYPDEYEVLVGGYRLPVVARDLAPELRLVAQEALNELQRLGGNTRVIARLMAALHR